MLNPDGSRMLMRAWGYAGEETSAKWKGKVEEWVILKGGSLAVPPGRRERAWKRGGGEKISSRPHKPEQISARKQKCTPGIRTTSLWRRLNIFAGQPSV